jgi:single-strand DNA-binding protein
MINGTISGRLGKDAVMRDTKVGPICSFSIASDSKRGGEKITTWVNCSIFGNRGEKLCQYLAKGTSVVVVGELSQRTYEGKAQLDCKVDQLDLMGGGQRHDQPATAPAQTSGGFDEGQYVGAAPAADDDFPF